MKKSTLLAGMIIIFCLSGQMLFGQTKSIEKFKYISPKPGSKYINPENTIAFRHGDVLDISSIKSDLITVAGSMRGNITGTLKLSKDQRTIIFEPDQPFALKEKINVVLDDGIKTISGFELEGLSFSFYTKEKNNYQMLIDYYKRQYKDLMNQAGVMETMQYTNSQSTFGNKNVDDYPDNYPVPLVTELDNPAPGYTFVSPNGRQNPNYGRYSAIIDNYGTAVYYGEWHMGTRDFKVVVNNRLTRSEQTNQNPAINKYLIMDSKFNIIDTLMMGNGYNVDTHDMLLLENGNYFLMAYDPQLVDMSQVVPGGDTNATVTGFVIQELDEDDNVIFQWRSWDHFEITDATHFDFTESSIDYVHGNAFEIDTDDNILMSCRAMDEITKIDRITGDIIWRFGPHAINNMFTFTNDTIGFYAQHDIRRIDNGNITLYDNGNYHDPKFSQSVEYELDEVNFTATLAWNYINDPVIYARATGASQRLANGNTLINWGMTGPISLTETNMDKEKLWEVEWHEDVVSYRGPKFDWVTDFFEPNVDSYDYGTFSGYTAIPFIFVLTNNSNEDIEITSTVNHTTSYNVVTSLPLTIPANGTANLQVNFFPTQQGQVDDVLTIRSEFMFADTLPHMIARQVFLTGYVLDESAPEATFAPSDGTVDVSQEQILSISFNESVVKADGSTLKTDEISSIIVFKETDGSGEDVGYSTYIDAWKKMITIIPDTLKPLQDYYLELMANTVADNSGNILTEAVTSTFTTEEEQGIIELSEQNFAKIYPNPNNGLINIEFQNSDPKNIRVYDLLGNVVYSEDNNQLQVSQINLQNLPAGVYVIKILNKRNNNSVEIKTLKN